MKREQPLLRTQLLTWLLVPLALLLAVDAFVGYWMALRFSQSAHDRVLVEIARELSLYLRAADGRLALDTAARKRAESCSTTRRTGSASKWRARTAVPWPASRSRRRRPGKGEHRLYDGVLNGEPVRIVELRTGADATAGRQAAEIRVAETEHKRNSLAREILLSVMLPQVLLILIAGIVVWVGVMRGLASLQPLQRAVAARSHLRPQPGRAGRGAGRAAPTAGVDQRAARSPRSRDDPAEPLHQRRRAPAEDADRGAAYPARAGLARDGDRAYARGAGRNAARTGALVARRFPAAVSGAQRAGGGGRGGAQARRPERACAGCRHRLGARGAEAPHRPGLRGQRCAGPDPGRRLAPARAARQPAR